MANYAAKFSPKVAERFKRQSYTAGAASNAYDFEGVKIVKIYSEDTFPFGNYRRSSSDRYGDPYDQTDSVQELEMTQDKGVSIIIDKGENVEKMNTQGANAQLKREIDEQATPMIDKYNFKKWIAGAGQVVALSAALNANTALDTIPDITEKLDEAFAPESDRTLWVTTEMYKYIKKDSRWMNTDIGTNAAVLRGQVGSIDNFRVVKVAKSYFPNNVYALASHKSAILAPVKLRDYNMHHNPPGVSGDRIDIRIMHDAFVIDAKANALVALAAANVVTNAATVTVNTTAENVEIKGSFDKAYYTLDGSDPRCSGTAVQINANTNVNTNGKTVKTIRVAAYEANKTVSWRTSETAYA